MLEEESRKIHDNFDTIMDKIKYSDYCVPFGKYQGCFLADVFSEDPEYFAWLDKIAHDNDVTDYPNLRGAINYLKGEK